MASEHPVCFVIMPFGGKVPKGKFTSAAVYNMIKLATKKAFHTSKIEMRLDKQSVQGVVTEAILKKLRSADLVIADLTGNNPNVLFELGYRVALDKPFVCISDNPAKAKFWASAYKIINYTGDRAREQITKELVEAYQQIENQTETNDQLDRLISKIRTDKENQFNNPFQDRLAAWRIERALEQVTSIQDRQWELDARMPYEYIAFIFQELIETMVSGEEYSTVSNMGFWSEKAVGTTGFLEANVQAVKSGVTIKRVILINKNGLAKPGNREALVSELKKHERACSSLQKFRPGKMEVKCLVSDHYEQFGHFGMMRGLKKNGEDGDRVLIIPHYSYDGTMEGLRLTFSGESKKHDMDTKKYVKKFEEAFHHKDARPLRGFLKKMSHWTQIELTSDH